MNRDLRLVWIPGSGHYYVISRTDRTLCWKFATHAEAFAFLDAARNNAR